MLPRRSLEAMPPSPLRTESAGPGRPLSKCPAAPGGPLSRCRLYLAEPRQQMTRARTALDVELDAPRPCARGRWPTYRAHHRRGPAGTWGLGPNRSAPGPTSGPPRNPPSRSELHAFQDHQHAYASTLFAAQTTLAEILCCVRQLLGPVMPSPSPPFCTRTSCRGRIFRSKDADVARSGHRPTRAAPPETSLRPLLTSPTAPWSDRSFRFLDRTRPA